MYTSQQFNKDLLDVKIGTIDAPDGEITSKKEWIDHCQQLKKWIGKVQKAGQIKWLWPRFVNKQGELLSVLRNQKNKVLSGGCNHPRGMVLLAELESGEWLYGTSFCSYRDRFYKDEAWGRAITRLGRVPTIVMHDDFAKRFLDASRMRMRRLPDVKAANKEFKKALEEFNKQLPGCPPSTRRGVCKTILLVKLMKHTGATESQLATMAIAK